MSQYYLVASLKSIAITFFFSNSGTILVTKTDYFCHKTTDNLQILLVKRTYKFRFIFRIIFNNRLFLQPISHDTSSYK